MVTLALTHLFATQRTRYGTDCGTSWPTTLDEYAARRQAAAKRKEENKKSPSLNVHAQQHPHHWDQRPGPTGRLLSAPPTPISYPSPVAVLSRRCQPGHEPHTPPVT